MVISLWGKGGVSVYSDDSFKAILITFMYGSTLIIFVTVSSLLVTLILIPILLTTGLLVLEIGYRKQGDYENFNNFVSRKLEDDCDE